MHNNCGEIFSGFCRNLVRIAESIRTTCYKMNDFEHSFSNFLIFSSQGENDDGREGGGVAKDAGGKEEKG